MKMQISFDLDNAAFDGEKAHERAGVEVAAVLETLTRKVGRHFAVESGMVWPLWDSNGNRIGAAEIVEG